MAKTLSFTDTSSRTVKIGDTTTNFVLICGNDNVATDLTNATSITAKLGNASGYLKSVTVNPASLTDPTTGQVTVKFTADLMTSLPAGSYALEIWVVDSTGTSIYPSDGSTGFTITNNIQSTNGSTITTITFDDFVQEMKEIASTIKGEKGDTGTVDNAGLTTAPAFVALQTQVNDSAVGTNLLTGTSSKSQTTSNIKGYAHVFQSTNGNSFTNFETGKKYTYSMNVMSSDGAMYLQVKSYSSSGTATLVSVTNQSITYTSDTRISLTFTIPTDAASLELEVVTNNWTLAGSVTIHSEKLELGSVATDWCPNPTEILTQADYSKIKAAIVALGGSLS